VIELGSIFVVAATLNIAAVAAAAGEKENF